MTNAEGEGGVWNERCRSGSSKFYTTNKRNTNAYIKSYANVQTLLVELHGVGIL